VYDGKAIADGTFGGSEPDEHLLTQFFAFDLDDTIGVSVAAGDFQGSGTVEILTGATSGPGAFRVVRGDASGVKPPALLEGLSTNIEDGLNVGA
jgi:hypothetical protein